MRDLAGGRDLFPDAGSSDGRRPADFLERARLIAPILDEEADEVERRGEVTPRVQEALVESELYWILVPSELGGGGQGIAAFMETTEELSRADGSAGWVFMACSGMAGAAAGFLPESGARKLFGGPDKAITAGQLAAMGRGFKVDGGFSVTGKYQFASGSTYASWIGAGFAIVDNGKPRTRPDGQIDQRVGLFPADQVEMRGNWDVSGLVGTGSYDYVVNEQVVDDDLTFERLSLQPTREEPVYRLGLGGIAIAGHASVALGLSKRALAEVATITKDKKRVGYTDPVGEYPVFMQQFCIYEANYQAARRYVLSAFVDVEATAAAGNPISDEQRARTRQAATWAHFVATDIVNFCRLWGGTQAFRNPSALGRVVRDVGVATQHALVDPKTLVDAAGAILRSWQGDRLPG